MTAAFPPGAALVVGGSGGVGQAISETLAAAGCDVALTFRSNRAAADAVAGRIRALGRQASVLPYQAGEPAATTALLAQALQQHPRIHTVVNAAGSNIPMRFINALAPQEWAAVIEADFNGFFNLAHACLPHLREHGGSIVQVSSVGIRRWPKQDVLSVAPKAGIEALVRGIAREEGRFGVRANCVQLGVIDTGIFQRLQETSFTPEWVEAARNNTALKRFGTAQDVAEAVLFLASDRAAYITGESIRMDGGFSL